MQEAKAAWTAVSTAFSAEQDIAILVEAQKLADDPSKTDSSPSRSQSHHAEGNGFKHANGPAPSSPAHKQAVDAVHGPLHAQSHAPVPVTRRLRCQAFHVLVHVLGPDALRQ